MRSYQTLGFIPLLLLAACGGGGSSGGGTIPPPPPPPKQVIAGPGPNVMTLTVNAGPASSINTAFISVKVCQPGSTTNCATIGGIEVDTGSEGLRLIAGAVPSALLQVLPQQVAGTVPIAECAVFADGYSWGGIRMADVSISSEAASNIPVQIIGDTSITSTVPSDCAATGSTEEDTVATFGANGILGAGAFAQDCGSACVTSASPGGQPFYYLCPSNGTCTNTTEALNLQVPNPVTAFATDNNGVIIELPSPTTDGAVSATGALVFGIGTQSNNGLGSATVLTEDPTFGFVDVNFLATDYPSSYLDSGSNAMYFTDSNLSVCASSTAGSGFYCSGASLTATITGNSGTQVAASFTVSDATTLFTASPTGTVFTELGAPVFANSSGTFDFGLPYFYGRNVFTAIEGKNTPGGMGPYVAF